ncbi:MAG: YdcF family protein [Lachnospiraceae bacterium]|nr:YdcF family protein [Lachnospiraceae bacterium]
MSKKTLVLIGTALFVLCAAVLLIFGQRYTVEIGEPYIARESLADESQIRVEIENSENAGAEMTGYAVENGKLKIRFSSVRRGKTFAAVYSGDQALLYFHLYTHLFGVITYDSFFGDSRGDLAVPLAMLLFFTAVLLFVIQRYRADVKRSMYQYRNVMELGLIIFLVFLLLSLLRQCLRYHGLIDSANDFLTIIHFFSVIVLPAAFVISLLVTVSNISLMRKEGRTWRNMLGIFLGVGLCLLTILPGALGEYLQWSPNAIMDVHNEQGAGLYIEAFTEGVISMLVTYLECILIGTVVFGIKAARHIPAFNKDYILILGSQIRKDGTLTPLLRSRADKALEFAKMQKEKTGKELVFVPSGGQGADEVMPEAAAIKNYLVSVDVPEEQILVEDKSADTRENIINSMRLIREHAGGAEVETAFSTTNYHVFRAGLIAQTQGTPMEGIGSPTKRYFWINAFIREFIATLVSEKKKHVYVIAFITLMIILAVGVKLLNAFL